MGGSIRDFVPYQSYPAGTWTDDTGMTLATCRALIKVEAGEQGVERAFREEFYRWAGSSECLRAGKTVLYSARYRKTDETSWANGALMRITPVGIYCHLKGYDEEQSARLALQAARITHVHELAVLPAVECALAIRSILRGDRTVPQRLFNPLQLLPDYQERYGDYLSKRYSEHYSVHPSTGLWMWRQVFELCLGMAEGKRWDELPGFEEGLIKTLDESFDKDTAGAVAGRILGAYWGEGAISVRWKNKVSNGARITDLADKFLGSIK